MTLSCKLHGGWSKLSVEAVRFSGAETENPRTLAGPSLSVRPVLVLVQAGDLEGHPVVELDTAQ